VVFSSALALIFLLLVLLRYGDDAEKAYSSGLNGERGDIAFLVGAGKLMVDQPTLLYRTGGLAMTEREWRELKGYTFPIFYPYAPLAAIATAVLAPFEAGTTATLWRAGVALASIVLGVCVAMAFRNWAWRIAIFACIVVWRPLLMNAEIGQTGAFVAALMAVGMILYLRDKKLGVLVLAFLALKPSVALAPTLIALQERPAIWLRYGLAAAALVFLPFVVLGYESLHGWLRILARRLTIDVGGGHSYNQGLSSVIGESAGLWVVLVLVLALGTFLAVRMVKTKLGLEAAMAFAVFGGCLVNPHSLFYDWGIAFVGVMLLRMSKVIEEPLPDIIFGLLSVSLFVAGQYTWEQRHDAGAFVRPLTAWTLLVLGVIFVATLRLYVQDIWRQRQEGAGWLQAARGL
jgi:hypothetical protein